MIASLWALTLVGCDVEIGCPEATSWVAEGAAGVGTQADPAGSIAAVVEAAPPVASSCETVTVHLASGTYTESLQLGRSLRLIGDGPQEDVRLAGSIVNDGHDLRLWNLTVRPPAGVGIRQIGGYLEGLSLEVSGTPRTADLDSGTAIWMSDGARAALSFTTLRDNQGPALRAQGSTVVVRSSDILANQAHPGALGQLDPRGPLHVASVELSDGSWGGFSRVEISDGQGLGLLLRDASRLRFDDGEVNRTTDADLGNGDFSANITVTSRSELEARRVDSNDSDFTGVFVSDAYWTTVDGWIRRNVVGAAIFWEAIQDEEPDYDPDRCVRGTAFLDNEVGIQAEPFVIPSLDGAASGVCRRVEFPEL